VTHPFDADLDKNSGHYLVTEPDACPLLIYTGWTESKLTAPDYLRSSPCRNVAMNGRLHSLLP